MSTSDDLRAVLDVVDRVARSERRNDAQALKWQRGGAAGQGEPT